MLFILLESLDSRILDISILNEFLKALFIYLSLLKFKSIIPSTFMLSTMKTFSCVKLLVVQNIKIIVAVKKIKIYSFNLKFKYLKL